MNKLLLLIFLLFCTFISAQDSIVKPKKISIKYTEKDILIDTSTISPAKFDLNFKKKYNTSEFIYEVKAKEIGAWDRFVEWLGYWLKKLLGLSSNVSSSGIDITLRIIAGIVIIVVIYLIVKAVLNKEGQWIFGKSTTKRIIHHEDIERNLQNVDFEKLIASTIKSGNQRLAIRYYYLWLLKKMSEKEIIDWNPEKTNSDYLYEIKNAQLKQNFSYASYLYNNIWYGEFEINDDSFTSIKKSFEAILYKI